VVDAGIARHVTGALTRAMVRGLENRQVDVPIREIIASPGLAHLLQAEHLLVKSGGLFRVRGADGDVLDLGHSHLPRVGIAQCIWLLSRPYYTRWGISSSRRCCAGALVLVTQCTSDMTIPQAL
jgi:hypothetical protein